MSGVKTIFTSKTLWAQVLGILFGIPAVAKYVGGYDIDQTATVITTFLSGLFDLLAVVARFVSTHQLVVSPTVASIADAKVQAGMEPTAAIASAKATVAEITK